jgi:Ca2+-transporting ATPase
MVPDSQSQQRPVPPTSQQDEAASPSTTVDAPPQSWSGSQKPPGMRPELSVAASFESRDSRPTSPHNVSSPVRGRGEGGGGFLSVPGNNLRSRQNSIDSDDASRSYASSQGDATTVAGSSSLSGEKTAGSRLRSTSDMSSNDKIMNDENALKPDVGKEAEFQVEDNPFAFTPGQMSKLFNPKNLPAFYALGGLAGLEKGLRSDRKAGLSVDEIDLPGQVTFEEATKFSRKEFSDGVDGDFKPSTPPHSSHGQRHGHNQSFADRKRVFSDNRLPEKKGKSLPASKRVSGQIERPA